MFAPVRNFLARLICSALAAAAPGHAAEARAAGPEPAPLVGAERVPARGRQLIAVGFVGGVPSAAEQGALAGLIDGERPRAPTSTMEEVPPAAIEDWIAARTRAEVLLIVVIDRRTPERWALYLVDASRDRAVRRILAAERHGAVALLESAASVISSAARALEEGLEIASTPVDALLERSALRAERSEQRPAVRYGLLRGSVAAAASTFESQAPLSSGVSTSLALSLRNPFVSRLSLSGFLPAAFVTELGQFKVQRSQAALTVGVETPLRDFELAAELGVAAELLRRRAARARGEAVVQPSALRGRAGPLAGTRLRWRLSEVLALEAALFLAYYPQRIEYVVAPANQLRLAAPWQLTFGALFGVDVVLLGE